MHGYGRLQTHNDLYRYEPQNLYLRHHGGGPQVLEKDNWTHILYT